MMQILPNHTNEFHRSARFYIVHYYSRIFDGNTDGYFCWQTLLSLWNLCFCFFVFSFSFTGLTQRIPAKMWKSRAKKIPQHQNSSHLVKVGERGRRKGENRLTLNFELKTEILIAFCVESLWNDFLKTLQLKFKEIRKLFKIISFIYQYWSLKALFEGE